jgi:hypothetical protein
MLAAAGRAPGRAPGERRASARCLVDLAIGINSDAPNTRLGRACATGGDHDRNALLTLG